MTERGWSLLVQLLEQCFGVFEFGGVVAFCEHVVDVGEHCACFVELAEGGEVTSTAS
jgi:hypothetical protein